MNLMRNKSQVIAYTVNKAINHSLYISVENGEVMVKAPWYLGRNQIQEIVEEKRQWIIKKLKEYEEINRMNKDYIQDKIVKILGKNYGFKIIYKRVKASEVNVNEKDIKIILPMKYKRQDNTMILKMLLQKMYDVIAEKEIERAMEKARVQLGFAPEDYKIKRINGILGQCENDNITINPDIVTYPREIIDYLVFHEFCHLKYKIHSKGFIKMIENYYPNYKEIESKIDNLKY